MTPATSSQRFSRTKKSRSKRLKSTKGWKRVFFWRTHLSYSECFNSVFAMFFLIGLGGLARGNGPDQGDLSLRSDVTRGFPWLPPEKSKAAGGAPALHGHRGVGPLPSLRLRCMRSWLPPFAKDAKDGAPSLFSLSTSRVKIGFDGGWPFGAVAAFAHQSIE
jgi:hypothetical protein